MIHLNTTGRKALGRAWSVGIPFGGLGGLSKTDQTNQFKQDFFIEHYSRIIITVIPTIETLLQRTTPRFI
jgi:hypothetical protein